MGQRMGQKTAPLVIQWELVVEHPGREDQKEDKDCAGELWEEWRPWPWEDEEEENTMGLVAV